MPKIIIRKMAEYQPLREVNPMLMSYNVEFAEVTGGTFWKAYTPAQVAGLEPFAVGNGVAFEELLSNLMQVYPPIDLYNPRLRELAKAFGPVWVRVSGSWATRTYYDFDGSTGGKAPAGYQNVLTKEMWLGVLDFVKAVGGKLLISVANCEGLHKADEPWNSSEAEKIFRLSKEYGVPIDAAEFANEPNMLQTTGFAPGYTAADYRRDQDLFFRWVRQNYPDCLCVGPCTTGGDTSLGKKSKRSLGGVEQVFPSCPCRDLMDGTKEPLDVFSYHFYNGASERLAPVLPSGHWDPEDASGEEYLAAAEEVARIYARLRDTYVPGGQMWVTEAGDAGGGGDTWASTYLDVLRTLNELGSFATVTNGVIFHNTLASSDYGFLQHGTFVPRPNYFAVLLWNRLMGTTVFDSGELIREGAHVYVHSRRDGQDGKAVLILNNSLTDSTTVELPKDAVRYTLAGKGGNIRATVMTLNGRDLVLGEEDKLPDLSGEIQPAGTVELAPGTCTFFVL